MNSVNFQSFAVDFVTILGNLLTYAIFARVVLSWLSLGQQRAPGPIASFINDITNPIFNLVKKLPHKVGMIDLSPIIALFGVSLLTHFLVTLLSGL